MVVEAKLRDSLAAAVPWSDTDANSFSITLKNLFSKAQCYRRPWETENFHN